MSERTMPGLGLRAFYAPGQSDWGQPVSEDLRTISAVVQLSVISRETTLPDPGSAGDIYIVPQSAASNAGEIALWDGETGSEAWVFIQPQEGWQAWVLDEALRLRFDGTEWVALPRVGEVAITSASEDYTLAAGDAGAIIEISSGIAQTVTIPDESAVPFAIGTLVNITRAGSGALTVAAAAGVDLNGVTAGSVDLDAQWAGAALYKRAADAWVIQGAVGEVS